MENKPRRSCRVFVEEESADAENSIPVEQDNNKNYRHGGKAINNGKSSNCRQNCCSSATTSNEADKNKSRSPSPFFGGSRSPIRQLIVSSASATSGILLAAPGYAQYQKSLLEVPFHHAEYGEASSDDLSSEWDSDVPEPPRNNKVVKYTILKIWPPDI